MRTSKKHARQTPRFDVDCDEMGDAVYERIENFLEEIDTDAYGKAQRQARVSGRRQSLLEGRITLKYAEDGIEIA